MTSSFAKVLRQESGGSRTRQIRPFHKEWTPHRYQGRGVDFLKEHRSGALFWDPGLGKTAVTLDAFWQLKQEGEVKRMLVIAPLRVCQLVWRQEGQKWTEFRPIRFSLLHGPKKAKALKEPADVYLINPEGVSWLVQQYYGRKTFPFDVVCIDELTKFKNHRAQRSKQLRKKIENVRYRWGLTGSPVPNGYEDLFGQILILDGGKTFGPAKTYYLDQYFRQGFNGFDWELREGAAGQIERKIAPLVLSMSADDYLELPQLVSDVIDVRMPPAAVAKYEEMKEEMLTTLPEGVVTAANAGGVYAKLKQLSNGAVYLTGSDTKEFAEIHDAKIDALKDLIEELNGRPLLVAYEFQHDLIRLRKALGEDTPALSGLSEKRTIEMEAAWNRGELPVMLVHPASVGHGLNLQAAAGSGTAHICWFSLPWDLELYEQTIRRLRRQGSEASRVVNHILRVQGGMDAVVIEALEEKDTTQQRLRMALNAEILRDDPAPTARGQRVHTEEEDMAPKKLGFRKGSDEDAAPAATKKPKGWGKGTVDDDDDDLPPTGADDDEDEDEDEQPAPRKKRAAAPADDDEDEQPRKKPKGWGKSAAASDDEDDDDEEEEEQRKRIRGKIRAPETEDAEGDDEDDGEPAQRRALKAFPKGVTKQLTGDDDDEQGDEDEQPAPAPKKRGRPKKAAQESPAEEAPADVERAVTRAVAAAPESTYAYATDRQGGERQTGFVASVGDAQGVSSMSLNISASGIPNEALAQIFSALAEHLRGK